MDLVNAAVKSQTSARRRPRARPSLETLEPRTLLASTAGGMDQLVGLAGASLFGRADHLPTTAASIRAAAVKATASTTITAAAAATVPSLRDPSLAFLLPTVSAQARGRLLVGEPLSFVVTVTPGFLPTIAAPPPADVPPLTPPLGYTLQMNAGTPASPRWTNVGFSSTPAVTVRPARAGATQFRVRVGVVLDADYYHDLAEGEEPAGFDDLTDLRGRGPGPALFEASWPNVRTDLILDFYSSVITVSPRPETTPNNATDIDTQIVLGTPPVDAAPSSRVAASRISTSQVSAAAAPPAEGLGHMTIDGEKMLETEANYQASIKFLTVPPEKQNDPVFKNGTMAQIKAANLEDPLRRLIFVRMNNNGVNNFGFKNLAAAQANFQMRIEMIKFMNLIKENKAVNFDYYSRTDPAKAATADPATWEHDPGRAPFVFRSKSGVKAHDAIVGLAGKQFLGECLGALMATLLYAADKVLQDPKAGDPNKRFNDLHPNGLIIGRSNAEVAKHIGGVVTTNQARRGNRGVAVVASISVADMVPGDWVYIKNKDDYNQHLRQGVAGGYWTGENALYMGDYATPRDKTVAPRFSGMGLYDKTEEGLKEVLSDNYNNEMKPPRTDRVYTATPDDVRFTSIQRPVTGASN